MKIIIVASKFNEKLMDGLIENTKSSLIDSGIDKKDISLIRVPGAYEIPQMINLVHNSVTQDLNNHVIYIALGVVIEGETNHAQMIIDATGQSLLDLSLAKNILIVNEIVGAPSYKIAEARCIGKENTRGWYAGKAVIELATEIKRLIEKNK
tara:strand:- start:145 stop:600 length:456 start_codon:yes stop_codon:yes gene_type:complete